MQEKLLLFLTLITDYFLNYIFILSINKVICIFDNQNSQDWHFPRKSKIISVHMKNNCVNDFVNFVFLIRIQASVILLFQLSRSGWLLLCFRLTIANSDFK